MAYASVPNIVTIHAPKIGGNELAMNTLTEILQSDSVKRLLDRQNVYLQTPLSDGSVVSDLASRRNSMREKLNGSWGEKDSMVVLPELSVIPIMSVSDGEAKARANVDDQHLLPSKTEGKSAIALLPLPRETRACGHSEPCESIICDVEIRRYRDKDDVTPLVAVNIEPDEIDAPVSKHCDNQKCDALSIDHDRCRRAVIRCHRCDRVNICDICQVVMKTRKAKMMHRNCKMRVEYRHNKTSGGKLMRDRMRIRELQFLEDAKTKRSNDYTDPATGHDRAIETLQKNSELIVIPRTSPPVQQHPTIRITSVTGAPIAAKNLYANETLGKLMPRYVLSSRRSSLLGKASIDGNILLGRQVGQSASIGRRGSDARGNEVGNSSHSQTTSYFMPVRVVPISGLRSEPSILHQTRGVPKFCLVPQATGQSTSSYAKAASKILAAQQQQQQQQQQHERVKMQSVVSRGSRKGEPGTGDYGMKRFKSGMRRGRRKKNGAKRGSKSFECTFCFKRFSTDWYFKLHIAKHKGEIKFTCKFCKKPFMHHYNMTKHVVTMHKQELTSEDESYIDAKNGEFLHCATCKVIFKTKVELDNHRCPILCLRCHTRITDGDLTNHLRVKHEMSEERAQEEVEKQKRQKTMIAQNRASGADKKRREVNREETRAMKIKETEPRTEKQQHAERENGTMKRKRSSINSNEGRGTRDDGACQISPLTPARRLTRRRNHCLVEQTANESSINGDRSDTRSGEITSEFRLPSITAETDLVSR